jgi:hypothetical protein
MNKKPPKPKGASKKVARILHSNAVEAVVKHRKWLAVQLRECLDVMGTPDTARVGHVIEALEETTPEQVAKEE